MKALPSLWIAALLLCSPWMDGAKFSLADTAAGDWVVKSLDGKACLRLSFAAQIGVHDKGGDKRTIDIKPDWKIYTGACELPYRAIILQPAITYYPPSLQLTFFLNNADHTYTMTKVDASWYDNHRLEYVDDWSQSHNLLPKAVPLGDSYSCDSRLTIELKNASFTMWDMHLQPFADYSDGQFGPEQSCHGSGTSVAVIVICAVLGAVVLVVFVVLVIFLMKRKKRNSGYVSIQGTDAQ